MTCPRCRHANPPAVKFCGECGTPLRRATDAEREGRPADITERKDAEGRFDRLIEHASDVISMIRPDGIILYESPSVERLLGWRPEELTGKQVLDYVHPDDVARVAGAIANRIADATPVNPPTEFRVRARDGSWRILAAMSRVTQDETGTTSLVVNSRDVTEERALEEQQRRAHSVESIGRLAGGIAHDFNNLLTVILGRSQLLRGQLLGDERARRNVEIIEDTARRAAALTRQLLAFGRKQMLQPEVLDLATLVTGLLPMLERLAGEQVTIITSFASGPGRVRADRAAIEQTLVTLVINAREAMPRGGRITLTIANVELDEAFVRRHSGATLGPHVVLTVSDTGTGMDPETLAHIFEPFFASQGPGRGTRLGLAAVYGVVTQHRGYIEVETLPGLGTSFQIYLPPPAESAGGPDAARDLVAAAPGAGTILLVEDEEGVRELAKDVLEKDGYTVIAAAGPREALEIAERHDGPLALLLTDVVMPDMNGRELAARVRRLRADTKVLFVSGYTDEAPGPDGAPGWDGPLLPKPFTASSLTREVARVLRAARNIS